MLQRARPASPRTDPHDARTPERPRTRGNEGFRDAVDGRTRPPATKKLPGVLPPTSTAAFVPTGLLVVADRGPGVRAAPIAPPAPRAAMALTDVRVGGAPGSTRVHATLGEGRHAGVELRAVEQHGRVAIELVATTPAGERALRGELSGLREALAARGCDGVSVDVRSGQDDGRARRGEESVVETSESRAIASEVATAPSIEGEIVL